MAKVCDKCGEKKLLFDLRIKSKKYEICLDCCNLLIEIIETNNKPKGLKKFLNNFEIGYGK
jgi:hypothetical protein